MSKTAATFSAAGRTVIGIGVPGLVLVHIPTWFTESGLPADGRWSVTHAATDAALQRSTIAFRSLHAAANYALRIKDITDWSAGIGDIKAALKASPGLSNAMRHAEAHAHEIDAAWPANTQIPFSNGPSIIDDDGLTRKYMAHAPTLDWIKGDNGKRICAVCGAAPAVLWGDE